MKWHEIDWLIYLFIYSQQTHKIKVNNKSLHLQGSEATGRQRLKLTLTWRRETREHNVYIYIVLSRGEHEK